MLFRLPRLGLMVMAMLCLVSLNACTRIDLAYRNLDVIIPWTVSDYLDMNRVQKGWFSERLKQHLSWHCSTQLPGYLAWIDGLQQDIAANRLDEQRVQALTQDAQQAVLDIATQVTPSAVELLQGLDDSQVREMREAFAEDLAKRRAEYVNLPLGEQIEQRTERMSKRLKPWLGSLNEQQQRSIAAWSHALGEQNREWIDNREHWQTLFIAAVEQRHNADFPARIAQLLQHRDTLWTPQYRAAYRRTEQASMTLFLSILRDTDAVQRAQLQSKLADLRQDFKKLSCLKAVGA